MPSQCNYCLKYSAMLRWLKIKINCKIKYRRVNVHIIFIKINVSRIYLLFVLVLYLLLFVQLCLLVINIRGSLLSVHYLCQRILFPLRSLKVLSGVNKNYAMLLMQDISCYLFLFYYLLRFHISQGNYKVNKVNYINRQGQMKK